MLFGEGEAEEFEVEVEMVIEGVAKSWFGSADLAASLVAWKAWQNVHNSKSES